MHIRTVFSAFALALCLAQALALPSRYHENKTGKGVKPRYADVYSSMSDPPSLNAYNGEETSSSSSGLIQISTKTHGKVIEKATGVMRDVYKAVGSVNFEARRLINAGQVPVNPHYPGRLKQKKYDAASLRLASLSSKAEEQFNIIARHKQKLRESGQRDMYERTGQYEFILGQARDLTLHHHPHHFTQHVAQDRPLSHADKEGMHARMFDSQAVISRAMDTIEYGF
ncbi:hypothetical protein CBS101457_000032 [Exobasidium rhododendri]|nr:hypothetical protein CBS101457_000032 [Exobasidium rhododendri]